MIGEWKGMNQWHLLTTMVQVVIVVTTTKHLGTSGTKNFIADSLWIRTKSRKDQHKWNISDWFDIYMYRSIDVSAYENPSLSWQCTERTKSMREFENIYQAIMTNFLSNIEQNCGIFVFDCQLLIITNTIFLFFAVPRIVETFSLLLLYN